MAKNQTVKQKQNCKKFNKDFLKSKKNVGAEEEKVVVRAS